MIDKAEICKEILIKLINAPEVVNKELFHKLKNDVYKDFKLEKWVNSIELLEVYRKMLTTGEAKSDDRILRLLRKRAVRSLSWVAVVSILTKPASCPWKCIYCPTFPNLPKSYIPNEPAVMRAELNAFDPIRQVHNRLRSLDITWHNIDKCDVRIIWWTWTCYDKDYKEGFIKDIYDAHNSYNETSMHVVSTVNSWEKFASFTLNDDYVLEKSESLEQAKSKNENSLSRVIWIAIETRPDYIDEEEIKLLRKYWVTRVEIWYQTTLDEINILNKRWHTNFHSKNATKLLKDAWFKVVAHIMPNLLWSDPLKDVESLKNVFNDSDFRPDELKIYPMVVTLNSELYNIWKDGWYLPYDDETLIDLMVDMQSMIPEYVRLNRMYRDIPSTEIIAWSHLANLRQLVEERMTIKWFQIKDISSREIRLKWNDPSKAEFDYISYDASWGKEYYLQMIDPKDRTLFSHLRLRIPSQYFSGENHFIEELQDTAIVREVHTYGDHLKVWESSNWVWQHRWLWRRLLEEAEKIIKNGYPKINRIAVIAWVWVRWYYKKYWYELQWEYMIKSIRL